MGGDSKTPKMEVTDYFMSVQFSLGHGPVDAIRRVVVKEKEAWAGFAEGISSFRVNKRNLFGGNKKEGGVEGLVHFLPGYLDQVVPDYLASRFGRTHDTMPAFRGTATVFFTSGSGFSGANFGGTAKGANGEPYSDSDPDLSNGGRDPTLQQGEIPAGAAHNFADIELEREGGFYWASNNPYLPQTWIRATRIPKVSWLDPAYAAIRNLVPEAVIDDPEPPEGEDETPDAENDDPLNGYYIGALPDEDYWLNTYYGPNKVAADFTGEEATQLDDGSIEFAGDRENFVRLLFNDAARIKFAALGAPKKGAYYRDYGDDANLVHVIAECMTNPVWGMGAEAESFNIPVWEAAAQQLFHEGFGGSFIWREQADIETIVTEMIDHIQATVFVSPRTGLWTIKLIRGGYDRDSLPILTPDNADLRNFQRKTWGETTNEVVVTWTNPENEADSTVTLQELANIAIQGGIISDGRSYYAVRNAALATKLAARDLRASSTPVASMDGGVDRSVYYLEPGDPVRVQWPERGIEDVVFRALKIDYGKMGSPTITLNLVEDVFALPTVGYRVLTPARPEPKTKLPTPLEYLTASTAPYPLQSRNEINPEYPDVGVLLFGATTNRSVESFAVSTEEALPTGELVWTEVATPRITTHAILNLGLDREFESVVAVFSAKTRSGGLPADGGLLFIGDDGDAEQEIAMFAGFDSETGYTLKRGMFDTVPKAWPPNTPVWIVDFTVFNGIDGRLRPAGVPVDYKIQSRTSEDLLAFEDAQDLEYTPFERPYLPFRPANCAIDGEFFAAEYAADPVTVTLTWETRNRLQEATIYTPWQGGSVTPEEGQTTTIEVYDSEGVLETSVTGLTGTTYDLPTTALSGGEMTVRFLSERDGFASLQAWDIALTFPVPPPPEAP